MFKRRNPRSILGHAREIFWPSMGWLRALKYAKHRVIRLSDTTHKIAAGLATGAAMSFSPLVGTHFVQCAIICYFTRSNMLASFIGTAVGNPWTFPFIWWGSFKLGLFILGLFGWEYAAELPSQVSLSIVWDIMKTKPFEIFLPWMLGGYILAICVWFPAYFIFYPVVTAGRAARRKVRLRRMHKVAKELTGQKH